MPSIWIFGYGSLVHRPGFEHARRVQGYIPNFRRVWHQGSTDHRGTPEQPGRVATLEPCPGALTWGVAYELAGDEQQQLETLRYLEWREKQYDVRYLVDVYGDPSQDGFAPPPPPVDISHLSGASQMQPAAATVMATSMPASASSPDVSQAATQPTAMVASISAPSLGTLANGSDPGQGVTSSADPLMSSEEVMSYAPPEDWQNLSATVLLQPPASITASATGTVSTQAAVRVESEPGTVPNTRLLLRNVLCYIASSDKERNHNYLGPASLDSIAQQIAGAHGPSGPNWEYVCKLAAAMRQMGVDDPELFQLESKVLALRAATLTVAAAAHATRQ